MASVARAKGALTIGVVTRPFTFEGKRRAAQAEKGIEALREKVDTLIVIPNDRLIANATNQTTMLDAFRMADDVLLQGVRGITDLITNPGTINTDFADVKTIMSNAGTAIMGVGESTGEGRALTAARNAITSQLLEAEIRGARGILVNVVGSENIGIHEVNEAMSIIHDVAHEDANIIWGSAIDPNMGEAVRVTVIAAGFDRWDSDRPAPTPPPSAARPSAPVTTTSDIFPTAGDDFLPLGEDDIPDFLK